MKKVLMLAVSVAWILWPIGGTISVASLQAESPPTEVTVTINVSTGSYGGTSVSFNPSSVTLAQGGTVTWVNQSNRSVDLRSPQAGFQTTIPAQGQFAFTFEEAGTFSVTASVGSASATMTVTVAAPEAPPEEVQEFALLHSFSSDLQGVFPTTLVVRKDVKVRLFNTSLNVVHEPIVISRDQSGSQRVFDVTFRAERGELTIVEFTPTETGEFFLTHVPHGHNIWAKLIVVESYPDVLKKLKELGVQELGLIHNLNEPGATPFPAGRVLPDPLIAFQGVPVRLFNTSIDQGILHDPVVISEDEDGQKPVFGIEGFRVELGKLTTVEFTPDQAGEFFITHKKHGHDIVGKLIVKEAEEK